MTERILKSQNVLITGEKPQIAITIVIMFVIQYVDDTFDIIICDRTAPSVELSIIGKATRAADSSFKIQKFMQGLHEYHNMPRIQPKHTPLKGIVRTQGIRNEELVALLNTVIQLQQITLD